jgi:hypothetical protein
LDPTREGSQHVNHIYNRTYFEAIDALLKVSHGIQEGPIVQSFPGCRQVDLIFLCLVKVLLEEQGLRVMLMNQFLFEIRLCYDRQL